MVNTHFLAIRLLNWFKIHKRDLPWRKNITPYRVWISEVMLQQTQVKTVIPYFHRWIKAFPTLKDLAEAPLEKVIKLWEGLGYYSRARNLHIGAQEVLKKYNGLVPSDAKTLLKISGIGPYTCSAIMSFAFNQSCTLVDGNVKRVMARFLNLHLDFSKPEHHRHLEDMLLEELPKDYPWIFNEALMEIGALICTPKNPQCGNCPLSERCEAKKQNTQLELPVKKERKMQFKLHRIVLVLQHEQEFLVSKQNTNLMKDLYEFLYFEIESSKPIVDHPQFESISKYSDETIELPIVKHSFTNFRVTLQPHIVKLSKKMNIEHYEWMSFQKLNKLPFSSGHRRVLAHLMKSLDDS